VGRLPRSQSETRNLYAGIDVGRSQDLTVISVLEKQADMFFVRALLRLRNVRLPQQQEFLETVCRSPRFAGALIDMTGLGLGLYEYTHQKFGSRIQGLNFASSLPLESNSIRNPHSALRNEKASAPEVLALRLLQTYESKRIRHPIDPLLREDLRKPERITTPEGRVSIVASRTESGHADHFWSLALALRAATSAPPSACATSISVPGRTADLRWARNLPRISRLRGRSWL
jgi:phage FluMu gp28-like protein